MKATRPIAPTIYFTGNRSYRKASDLLVLIVLWVFFLLSAWTWYKIASLLFHGGNQGPIEGAVILLFAVSFFLTALGWVVRHRTSHLFLNLKDPVRIHSEGISFGEIQLSRRYLIPWSRVYHIAPIEHPGSNNVDLLITYGPKKWLVQCTRLETDEGLSFDEYSRLKIEIGRSHSHVVFS
jgi:hypothetical protein